MLLNGSEIGPISRPKHAAEYQRMLNFPFPLLWKQKLLKTSRLRRHLRIAFDDPEFVEEDSSYFEDFQQKLDISI